MKYWIIGFLVCSVLNAQSVEWETIDTGFEIGKYQSPLPSGHGDDIITILRIDPIQYRFEILHDEVGYTARQWAKEHEFLAVVNAGMYDSKNMNMGFMTNYDSEYNLHRNQDNAILGLNPKSKLGPEVKIIDLPTEDWFSWYYRYNSYTQSIRMIDSQRRNIWSQSHRIWSVVVVATDKNDNLLFIHSRSPYGMHDFINMMLDSSLEITRMMYLEGGPPASMYIDHCDVEFKGIGSYESDIFEDDSNYTFWRLPNVIGITKKK